MLSRSNTKVSSVRDARSQPEVILIASLPTTIFDMLEQLGEVPAKIIINATNTVRQSPDPSKTVYHCLEERTSAELIKCFNSTGVGNMLDPIYDGVGIYMFTAGDSEIVKVVATRLALYAGFDACIDLGKSDKVELLEEFALAWINLAIMQRQGSGIAF